MCDQKCNTCNDDGQSLVPCPVVSVNGQTGAVVIQTGKSTTQEIRNTLEAVAPIVYNKTTGRISHEEVNIQPGVYGGGDLITVDEFGHITDIQQSSTGSGGGTSLSANLQALDSLTGIGILVRTGLNTWALREILGTSNNTTVSNGNGVATNPRIESIGGGSTPVTPFEAPVLSGSVNGSVTTLSWTSDTDAFFFKLETANNTGFSNPTIAYQGFDKTFQVTNATGYYRVRQYGYKPTSPNSNTYTANSQPPAFSINPEPVNQSGNVGSDATFTSGATGGTGSITYQWQTGTGDNPTDWTNYSGATGTSFVLTNIQLSQNNLAVRLRATQNGTTINSTLARLNVTAVSTYSARIGYKSVELDPFIDSTTAPIGVTYLTPTTTISDINSAIVFAKTMANFISLADNYVVLEIDSAIPDPTQYTNGGLGPTLIPTGNFVRKATAGGKKYFVSDNPFPLSSADDLVFTH